ncbi:dGTP triphosphohydrolase [Botrimarina hoheduenensis]|uniref:Deoxyguanosinetriphosphate triphosphohydrolase-like protein n=1 Tax=Botrimarina hoheduenensis TaxID=2528000 RepID=A0A5C5WC85_9BACT|nr:dNTP triphosphohydrolase [Botrimarina hoheduenensis]TWT47282.1 Deoxyguanosinetriphosphate triphosphohydrolase [Botrimarina hoheduenensis]
MHYAEREALLLAPYAMHAKDSDGRCTAEPDHPYRSPYQRDRDRITHSAAYRRLSHKTQVFTGDLAMWGTGGDYHRTRLTHTLEVASVARTVARTLRLNEDLVEALALAHDVGHPPFGHAGEELLNERLATCGGFNHNRQALRIFERLERRYADREGLNLTAEVLQGQRERGTKPARTAEQLAPQRDQQGDTPLLEAQVVDAADSIAYDAHDADDALEIGLLTLDDLEQSWLWREAVARVRVEFAALPEQDLRRAAIRELIDRQVGDLVTQSQKRIEGSGIDSVRAVRATPTLIQHTEELAEGKLELESLLFRRVYRHPEVLAHRVEARAALTAAFDRCAEEVERLPPPLPQIAREESPERAVADHISSLTDRAVLESWRRATAG